MPSKAALPEPRIARYLRFLDTTRGLRFEADTPAGYDALWRWSVDDLPAFWASIWEHFDLRSPTPYKKVLSGEAMPGARWFEGAQVNYAQQALRHAEAAHAAGHPAIVFRNERMGRALQETSWPELRRQVAALALQLRRLGIAPGDRVAAYLPNLPQTIVAFLACASVGAVWSVCSPYMGPVAVLDRFRQIEPKALIAVDGYVYGGVAHDRLPLLRELLDGLPTVSDVVLLRDLHEAADGGPLAARHRQVHDFAALVARRGDAAVDDGATAAAADAGSFDAEVAAFQPLWLPFDHPLWIVYSSGTTGLPKAIVHGHGGVMVNSIKANALHHNLGASAESGDRFHWYSSSGWIMWNAQVSGLLNGVTLCLYDGSPGGPAPAVGPADWGVLWRFAADAGVTYFGAGAAFYASCLKAGVEPMREGDLSALRGAGSTGSPLSDEGYQWIWDHLPKRDGRDLWVNPISGGTDFAGAFVAGMVTLPVVKGEMQCRCLGAAVEAWSEPDAQGRGRPLVDAVGELVCTKPIPSMPLYFWNDPGGHRYRSSYFEMYPGVWRHGDWIRITPRGGAVIYGRSDATINRHGIRMGTAELYRAVEALPEVVDSLVVDLEYLGRESWMPLFVVLREGLVLDAALTKRLKDAIKTALSARHVPNDVFQVAGVPRTLSGKKMELPVKKLLMGADAKQVLHADAMANPGCIGWYEALARRRAQGEAGQTGAGPAPLSA